MKYIFGIVILIVAFLLILYGFYKVCINLMSSAKKYKNMSDKHLALYILLSDWLKMKNLRSNFIEDYLMDMGYRRIAIYGLGYVGEALYDELSNSHKLVVSCVIDKQKGKNYNNAKVVGLDEIIDDVDVIIVTAISFYNQIECELKEYTNAQVISIEEIIYNS